jgi:hypothetical protein
MVTFSGVIEDYVQNYLDTCAVQSLDHIPELFRRTHGILPGAVGLVRCEEGHWCIAPVVDPLPWAVLGVELKYRKKFDCRYTQVLEIGNLLDEPAKSAARLFTDSGARMPGKTFDVHLVDDCLRGGPLKWFIAFPIIQVGIDNDTLHRRRGVVSLLLGRLTRVISRNGHSSPIWVEQNFRRVESHPFGRIIWPMNSIAIELTCLQLGNEDMPIVISAVSERIQRNDP